MSSVRFSTFSSFFSRSCFSPLVFSFLLPILAFCHRLDFPLFTSLISAPVFFFLFHRNQSVYEFGRTLRETEEYLWRHVRRYSEKTGWNWQNSNIKNHWIEVRVYGRTFLFFPIWSSEIIFITDEKNMILLLKFEKIILNPTTSIFVFSYFFSKFSKWNKWISSLTSIQN